MTKEEKLGEAKELMSTLRNLPASSKVPFCHTRGTDPVGYETELAEAQPCQDCADKFTCLPEGIKTGLIQGVDLSIDSEVKAGYLGLIPVADLRKRLEQRAKLRDAGKEIPADLTFDNIPSIQKKLDTLSNAVVQLHDPSKGKGKMSKAAKVEIEEEDTIEEPEEEETEVDGATGVEVEEEPEDEDEDTAESEESDEAEETEEDDETEEDTKVKAPKAKKAVKVAKPAKVEAKPKKAKPVVTAPVKAVKASKPAKAVKAAKPAKVAPEAPVKPGRGRPKKGTVAAATVKLPKVPKVAVEKKTRKPAAKQESKFTGPKNRLGEKGAFKYPGKPKTNADGTITLPNSRTVPAPKSITPEQMTMSLERINKGVGLDFDLEVGMTLVQERRNGDPIEVKLVKDGFKTDDKVYASLSTACMARVKRMVSGIDMFNFSKRNNILVKGKAVPGGSFRRAAGAAAEPEEEAAE